MALTKHINKLCEKFPYTTQGVVSATFAITGDVVAQKFIEKKEKLDVKRTLNFMAIGYVTGLALNKWYGILDKTFMKRKPLTNAVQKLSGEKSSRKISKFH